MFTLMSQEPRTVLGIKQSSTKYKTILGAPERKSKENGKDTFIKKLIHFSELKYAQKQKTERQKAQQGMLLRSFRTPTIRKRS